ncbi:MAG: Geranylgeranyl pyrophosphate synthase [Candidatus Saccharibacteria bacterium]|nr:Geranylgeranyl pyrophosphate synthase [Candidatus Saccharibacteria bacterium]
MVSSQYHKGMSKTASPEGLEMLKPFQEEIGARVTAFFQSEIGQDQNLKGEAGRITDQIVSEFAERPAKRIRGALAMVAYEMFGGQDREQALQLAVALEVSQNSLVILDDVMDESVTRRGGPTAQEMFKAFIGTGNPGIGNHLATNAGVILGYAAEEMVLEIPCDSSRKVRLLQIYNRNMKITGYGQGRDLVSDSNGLPTEEDVYQTIGLKTGPYTFMNPLQTGACLAGASDDTIAHLGDFGWHAGVAFQLRDDYLGVFGEEAAMGKSALSDVREGKMTLLMQYVLSHAGEKDKALVKAVKGADEVSEHDLLAVRRAMLRSGALQYVETKMYEEASMATEVLDYHTEWDPKGVAFLRKLIGFLIKRDV